jgi:hypothetical protein
MAEILINPSQDNTGSIVEIYYIDYLDVTSIPDADSYLVAGNIVLNAGKAWTRIQVSLESPGFEVNENKSHAGSGMNISLTAFHPGHSATLDKTFNGMRYRRYLVVAPDHEGKKRLFGTLKNPIRFTYNFATGTKTSARKGYDLKFYHTSKESPLFYNGALATS